MPGGQDDFFIWAKRPPTGASNYPVLLPLSPAGFPCFLVDLAQYAGLPFWARAFMLFHLVVVFDLLILIPFTKFAHVVYRAFALWLSRIYGYVP